MDADECDHPESARQIAVKPKISASFLSNDHAAGYWILLLGIPALLAFASILLVPLSAPQPNYLRYAQEYAKTGRIAETAFPAEFAWLTGLSLKAFGTRGPELLEAMLYLSIVVSVWALARKGGATARNAFFAATAAAVYPRLAEGVTKVWDVEISVLLMVALMLCTVSLMQHELRLSHVFATAVVFGLGIAQRPNMLLLFPLPPYFGFASSENLRRKLLALAFGGVFSAVVLIAVNTLAHGSFFLSQNGPYNVVQGHNEYSSQAMLRNLTSEPSVGLVLKADGMDQVGEDDEGDPKLQRYFMRRAFAYIRAHPLEEAKLTVIKLWTFLRPDTRLHSGLSLFTAPIVCMSLIFPAWLILLLRRNARTGLDRLDWAFCAAVALYVLPFLLTASDPRYQIPIEICLLSHMACMAGKGSPA